MRPAAEARIADCAEEADWPEPVETVNPDGASPILLVCEHASNYLPSRYRGLGLSTPQLTRHIAWDIGADALTRALAERLDAAALLARFSRLLVDLNRPHGAASAMPRLSEDVEIPGNLDLSVDEREERIARVFTPFHDRIARCLDERRAAGRATMLVAVHSFTPVFLGQWRPWPIAVLFARSDALGLRIVERLRRETGLVGVNEPYRIRVDEDYTIPVHGDARGLPAVLIEVRNDGLEDATGVARWCDRLAMVLESEVEAIGT